ncbi:MAG: Rab family GTPase [Candidatus Helarchaeota archaeon]
MADNKTIMKFKMVLFGNEGVGKTSLVDRFVNDKFEEDYIATLGYNVFEKKIEIDEYRVSLVIYDIGGQERFRELRRKYAEGADTAFIVYDMVNLDSFNKIQDWKFDLFSITGDIPFIVIGNKVDLDAQRVVSKESGLQLSNKIGALGHIETSAKTGQFVEEAFQQLAIKTLQRYAKK